MIIVATTSLPAVGRPNADRLERHTLVPIEQRQRQRDKYRETETKRLRQRLRCQRVEFQIDQLLTNSMTD